VAIGLSELGDNADSYDEYDLVAGAFTCIASAAIEKTPKATPDSHEDFIFDSGANVTIVNKEELLVDNVQQSSISLNGLHGEETSTTLTGDTAQFGKATLKRSCPFHLAAMKGLKDAGFKISLNEEADVFTITRGHEMHTFSEREDGLFHLDRKPISANVVYTAKQVERAKLARELHCALGHPGDDALCAKLDHGGILNCPVTSRDVRAARSLLGPCVVCQVGKTTNRTAPNPPSPTTQAPGDLIHVDIIYVRRGKKKSSFLIAVDEMTGHLSTFRLKDKRPPTIDDAIKKLSASYAAAGITLRKVRCDHESSFIAKRSKNLETPF
jgi:hypothetical protein